MLEPKCHVCNVTKDVRVDPYLYKESGLSNLWIQDIKIYSCPSCGLETPVIPCISLLHDMIAECIVLKPFGLNGHELEYLRKWLKIKLSDLAADLKTPLRIMQLREQCKRPWDLRHDLHLRCTYLTRHPDKQKAHAERIVPILFDTVLNRPVLLCSREYRLGFDGTEWFEFPF